MPDVRPVWRESCRTLRKGGRLLAGFYNPIVCAAKWREQALIRPLYKLPHTDTRDLEADQLEAQISRGEALAFGHSLADQIGGQTEAGFRIAGFSEASAPVPRFVIDDFMPTFIATLAFKPH